LEADPLPPVLTQEQVRLCKEALAHFEPRSKQLDEPPGMIVFFDS
jgi:hypothetical protein